MAIVKGPALSLEASGNLGSICYSRSRGIQIARGVWTGTYPNTSLQQASNALMTIVSQYWGSTLTTVQRQLWKDAAREIKFINRLGQGYSPSGYHYFLKVALQQQQLGYSITVIPPSAVPAYDVDLFYVDNSSAFNAVLIKMVDSSNSQIQYDGFQIWKAGPYDSDGYTPSMHDYRFYVNETASKRYYDYSVIEEKWYWYLGRWFESSGAVGNWWRGNVLVDFPG